LLSADTVIWVIEVTHPEGSQGRVREDSVKGVRTASGNCCKQAISPTIPAGHIVGVNAILRRIAQDERQGLDLSRAGD
jgi:hypothetical protein